MTIGHDIPWLQGVNIHMYCCPYVHDSAVMEPVTKVNRARNEILDGKPNDKNKDLYDKYLIIKKDKDGKVTSVSINTHQLDLDKKYAGYWMLADTLYGTAADAHALYRQRNYDEVGFDDVKNLHDAMRRRNHTPETVEGKFFLVFIAQVLENQLRNKVNGIAPTKRKHMTGREMLAG